MPEGPEVKGKTEWLNKRIKNKKLVNIKILSGRYKRHKDPINWDKLKKLLPLTIKSINCKGKFIWWEFKDTELSLWNTLGMSGWCNTDSKLKHNNLMFEFENKTIYFNDVRNFGTIKICTKDNLDKKLKCLGPDILNYQKGDFQEFLKRIKRKRNDTFICNALLDQKLLSGIGNYLRADILYLSKICPFYSIKKLNEKQLKLIFDNSEKVANRSYKIQYSKKVSKKDLIHPSLGYRFFFIYGKNKDPYGNIVLKKKVANRTIHYVPKIQK